MKAAIAAGLASIAVAQFVRGCATDLAPAASAAEPFAPSPETARIVSLGYNEVAADLLFFRLVGYFAGKHHTPDGLATLVEAIVTLDPHYRKAYVWGGQAIVHGTNRNVDRRHYLRAIALLERGAAVFPDDHELPKLAGEIYVLDLTTDDVEQRRRWVAAGTALLEQAVRKPGAPASLGTWIAHLRTKLGQKERATRELRELLLITNDDQARAALLAKLAELEESDSAEIAADVLATRKRFEAEWKRELPFVPATLYVIVGPRPPPGFDFTEIATGGRDLVHFGDDAE